MDGCTKELKQLVCEDMMLGLHTNTSELSVSASNTGFLFTMAVFTIFGNVLVLWTLWKDPAKELRTVSNFLIANLSVSDLILGLVGEPIFAATHWKHDIRLYTAARTVIDLSIVASLLSILALSFERYFMLKSAGSSESSFRRKHAAASAVGIWTLACAFAAMVPFTREKTSKVVLAFGVGMPIGVVLFIVYIYIYRVVQRVYRKDREASTNGLVLKDADRRARRVRERELQVAWTIFSIIGVFWLFWMPAIISDGFKKFCASPFQWCHLKKSLSDLMVFIGFLNSAFNPVVYSLRTKKFRRAVYLIVFTSAKNKAPYLPLIA